MNGRVRWWGLLISQLLNKVRIIGNKSLKRGSVFVLAVNIISLDGYLIHLTVGYGSNKLAVARFLLALARMVEHVEQQDHHQADDQPES